MSNSLFSSFFPVKTWRRAACLLRFLRPQPSQAPDPLGYMANGSHRRLLNKFYVKNRLFWQGFVSFFSRELSRLPNICFVSPSFSACSSACEISSLGWLGLRRPRSKSPHSTQSKNASKPEFYLGEKLGMVSLSSWFKTKILQSKGSTVFSTENPAVAGLVEVDAPASQTLACPTEATVFKNMTSIICPKYTTHFYQAVLTNRAFNIAFYGNQSNLLQCTTKLDEKQFIWHNKMRSYGQLCQINKR